jgi:CubicO group peptidase (beta-lactamase class C family)
MKRLAVGLAALACIQVVTAADDRAVEQRIARITTDLLPAVLVRGEARSQLKLMDRMREAKVPGVSVAVINDGKIEWARGFGVTRIDGPAVTPDTLFQAASISKTVSAVAVMTLVQAGKLELDADVNEYLKNWKLPANEFTRETKVTLRGLLSHTAGITVHGFAGYEAGAALPTLTQILDGQPPANNGAIRVDSTPGKNWRYSGGGYVIATLLLNDVTGESFDKLLHERVLKPFEMTNSTFEQPLSTSLLARAATPYQGDGTAVRGGPHVYPELAAASLWTTPTDLARFAIGMQQALTGKSNAVLSAQTARAMLVPVNSQQAIGFVVGGSPEHRFFNHGGANAGYRCLLVAYENGDGAAIMTSSDSGDAIIRPLLASIAHEYEWPDYAPAVRTLSAVSPQSFDRYVGAYRLANGMTVTFWRDGERRYSRVWGQAPAEMFPSSEREYFLKIVDARWVFAAGGSAKEVVLYQNSREQIATRLEDAEGRAALELSLTTQQRFKEQAAAPTGESALRKLISGIAVGKPDYDQMVPGLADITRAQLAGLQAGLAELGPVQAVTFKAVGPAGDDVYEVRFAHGVHEFRILLDPDGRIYSAQFSP